ncbi:MAG: PilZ domain-containing protein [Tardiphaga sp.]
MAMTDKRIAPRHRVLKRGILTFGGGAIDCTVRSLSQTGARVDVESPVGVPQDVTLVIETEKFSRRCHPVWKKEKQIGLAFD